jgi:peptidoglycan/LPS O-acetylase OafA/YrhL
MIKSDALKNTNQLDSLIFLRGIAALMVGIWHFGGALNTNHASHAIFSMGIDYGQFAVRMFFVISGFVIPLSLGQGRYTISNYFRFLYKRGVRLHIPFLVAVVLTLLIMLVSYKIRHLAFPETASSIIKMCFYMHVPVDNQVFWTLAIEAQYYAFIGLFFILLNKFPSLSAALFIPLLVLLGYTTNISQYISLFTFITFFFIGNIGYLIFYKKGNLVVNYIVLTGLLICSYIFHGVPFFIASLITILVILYFKFKTHRVFYFLGTISYSFYLIHFPIGMKLINVLKFRVNPSYDFLLLSFVLALVIGISTLFWKFVEKPSEALSRKMKYH